MTNIDLSSLNDEQYDALSDLVHEQASQLASDALNEGKGVDFLLGNGWTTEDIEDRLAEMAGAATDTSAEPIGGEASE